MAVQTYCTRTDVETIWSATAVIRSVDDDQDGSLSALEQTYITGAIERAANKINAALETRYSLTELAGNAWCRDANAALAAYMLATRRGNPAPEQIALQRDGYLADLEEIRVGRLKVPQVAESCETIPTVTNFDTELRVARTKVRRVDQTSTGSAPAGGRKSHPID